MVVSDQLTLIPLKSQYIMLRAQFIRRRFGLCITTEAVKKRIVSL
jgi:hypothetical protein